MKRMLIALVAIGLGLPAAAMAQSDDAGVVEFEVAGIPVIYKPIEGNEVIAVKLYLEGGSANLTPETAGIENFMTTAATHGTEKYSRDEFASRSSATGTAIFANVNPDYTSISLQAVSSACRRAPPVRTSCPTARFCSRPRRSLERRARPRCVSPMSPPAP